jgi:uncharacterized protein VirK/YbjX
VERALRRRGKLLRRIRQFAYLVAHPISHGRCMTAVARSQLNGPRGSLKYLGDHLALSLRTSQRREALVRHHSIAFQALSARAATKIRGGAVIWQRPIAGGPPLSLILEPSALAPMEGELQLKFSFRSVLYVLTFLFAPGQVFNRPADRVLFIGGLQGRFGSRQEIREASKLNHEIAPATMLMLAVRAIAREFGADELLAIGESDQVSMSYSAPMVRFDYGAFWTEIGGTRTGHFYSLPIEAAQKPLSAVPLTHRSRARRKREEKQRISESIAMQVRKLLAPERARSATIAFHELVRA